MPEALRGKRVLLTRPAGQNDEFRQRLRALGAIPIEFPTIQITPPADPSALDAALARLEVYCWIVFTSANAVEHVCHRLLRVGRTASDFSQARIAAIGPATAAALAEQGVGVDLVPGEHVAEALVEQIGDVAGQRILLPAADIARPTLAAGLQAKGAIVDRVVAYQTKPVEAAGDLTTCLNTLDVLTFASSSAARNFVHLLNTAAPATAIGRAIVACIGPATAKTAEEMGLPVHVVAETYSIPGLTEALVQHFTNDVEKKDSK